MHISLFWGTYAIDKQKVTTNFVVVVADNLRVRWIGQKTLLLRKTLGPDSVLHERKTIQEMLITLLMCVYILLLFFNFSVAHLQFPVSGWRVVQISVHIVPTQWVTNGFTRAPQLFSSCTKSCMSICLQVTGDQCAVHFWASLFVLSIAVGNISGLTCIRSRLVRWCVCVFVCAQTAMQHSYDN